jgi:hypothetical protein
MNSCLRFTVTAEFVKSSLPSLLLDCSFVLITAHFFQHSIKRRCTTREKTHHEVKYFRKYFKVFLILFVYPGFSFS